MGDEPGRIHEDLLAQQAAFFESYFKKGAQFTRELMEETQRLRSRLAELEVKLGDGGSEELERRFNEIERENNDLAALYVAQSQLHSSLEVSEVVQVIAEVLLNFVGAEKFSVMLVDGEGELRPITSAGISEAEIPGNFGRYEVVKTLLERGGLACPGFEARTIDEEPVAAVALRAGHDVFGVIGIWAFLRQKESVTVLDEQIFEMLGNNGGLALQAARMVGEAQKRVQPSATDGAFERISRLLK